MSPCAPLRRHEEGKDPVAERLPNRAREPAEYRPDTNPVASTILMNNIDEPSFIVKLVPEGDAQMVVEAAKRPQSSRSRQEHHLTAADARHRPAQHPQSLPGLPGVDKALHAGLTCIVLVNSSPIL